MSDNLIKSGEFYFHPLTRIPPARHRMGMTPEGELVEEPQEAPKLAFRASLIPREVVEYYYESVALKSTSHMNRDMGSVKYLARTFGLDKTLFAIDAVINDHNDGEDRTGHPPDLIKASDYMTEAEDRIGEVSVIARQYQVNHV